MGTLYFEHCSILLVQFSTFRLGSKCLILRTFLQFTCSTSTFGLGTKRLIFRTDLQLTYAISTVGPGRRSLISRTNGLSACSIPAFNLERSSSFLEQSIFYSSNFTLWAWNRVPLFIDRVPVYVLDLG